MHNFTSHTWFCRLFQVWSKILLVSHEIDFIIFRGILIIFFYPSSNLKVIYQFRRRKFHHTKLSLYCRIKDLSHKPQPQQTLKPNINRQTTAESDSVAPTQRIPHPLVMSPPKVRSLHIHPLWTMKVVVYSLVPIPIPTFSMLHAEKVGCIILVFACGKHHNYYPLYYTGFLQNHPIHWSHASHTDDDTSSDLLHNMCG